MENLLSLLGIFVGISALATAMTYIGAEIVELPDKRRRDLALSVGGYCFACLTLLAVISWVVSAL